jgi:hypothetical protein
MTSVSTSYIFLARGRGGLANLPAIGLELQGLKSGEQTATPRRQPKRAADFGEGFSERFAGECLASTTTAADDN